MFINLKIKVCQSYNTNRFFNLANVRYVDLDEGKYRDEDSLELEFDNQKNSITKQMVHITFCDGSHEQIHVSHKEAEEFLEKYNEMMKSLTEPVCCCKNKRTANTGGR